MISANPIEQAERLARMEVLLEGMSAQLVNMNGQMRRMETDMREDKEALAALKNRGAGILMGVALAAGGVGAAATSLWKALI